MNIKKPKLGYFKTSTTQVLIYFKKNSPLTETKEYNLPGNVITYRGNYKKAGQELTKKGLKVKPVFLYKSEVHGRISFYYKVYEKSRATRFSL